MELSGKFHSHITVLCDDDQIPKLRELCKELRCVVTVIDLQKETQAQRDIMLTHHFFIGRGVYNSVEDIKHALQTSCDVLSLHGFNPVRTKLEHESLPTVEPSVETYREVHFKCILPAVKRDAFISAVRSMDDTLVPSNNPYETFDNGDITQFINKRYYDGTVEEADKQSDAVASMLSTMCTVKEVKRESIVYDSNLSHDKWWA